MNNLNYASLEASKKLHDAGIVLEAEAVWRKKRDKTGYYLTWKKLYHRTSDIPAPSMAEVWRELPEQYENEYLRVFKDGDRTFCGRSRYGEYANGLSSKNPTDALINLLIYIRKEKL
jgi:hypothetical protein